jgi:DNA-binding NarL/FixJ family response regulator
MIDKISVFLLAENRLVREALSKVLVKGEVCVLTATSFSPQLLEQIIAAGLNVLLSDSGILNLGDLQVIRELRKAVPGLKVILIGMEPDKETFLRAMRDGVVGYMLKDASAVEIAAAVRSVMNDEAVCPPNLWLSLIEYVSGQWSQMPSFAIKNGLGLSRREQQLAQMIGRGLTNKEIASELNLSEQTVKNHIHRMLRKVGVSDRLSVAELCRMQGLPA